MNLYRVEQNDNRDYDTFDSFVCVAGSEEEARRMQPRTSIEVLDIDENGEIHAYFDEERCCEDHSWAKNLKNVDVELIGVADQKYDKPTVILASFNAG